MIVFLGGILVDFGYFWGPSCGGPGVSDCEGFQCHSWRAPTPNEPLQVPCGGEADTIVVCMQLHFKVCTPRPELKSRT